MTLEYFTGIEFHERSGEYRSQPNVSPLDALGMALIGSVGLPYKITFYAKQGDDIVGIPYSEIWNLIGEKAVKEDNLEEQLAKAMEKRFKKNLPMVI